MIGIPRVDPVQARFHHALQGSEALKHASRPSASVLPRPVNATVRHMQYKNFKVENWTYTFSRLTKPMKYTHCSTCEGVESASIRRVDPKTSISDPDFKAERWRTRISREIQT